MYLKTETPIFVLPSKPLFIMYLLFLVITISFFCVLYEANLCVSTRLSDFVVNYFSTLTACIIPVAFLLSKLKYIHLPLAWSLACLAASLVYFWIVRRFVKQQPLVFSEALQLMYQKLRASLYGSSLLTSLSFSILLFGFFVPADAIVALGTQQEHEDFEYPLWGRGFTRKLIPIHPFRKPVKPIPEEAQYLFY